MSSELVYRKDIDGLRAIAVLSVVFFHAFPPIVKGGFIGVDIFFIISGYLISCILFKQVSLSKLDLITFYIRRVKRIFPALLVVLITSLILGYFLLFDEEYKNLGKHVLGSALFINNFILFKESGYFDSASNVKPLLHLWSLGIEEQFYLIWPCLVYFIWKIRARAVIFTLFILISFLLNVLMIKHHQILAFYLPFTRFWELLLGSILAYYSFSSTKQLSVRGQDFLSSISIVLLLIAFFKYNQGILYPGIAALLPTLVTLSLIVTEKSWVNRNLLSHPSLIFIGLISYPLYLWHWIFLSLSNLLLGQEASILLKFSLILLSIILAFLTYQLIEKPLRLNHKNSSKIAIFLVCALGITGIGGWFLYLKNGLKNRTFIQTRMKLMNDLNSYVHFHESSVPCDLHQKIPNKMTDWCLQTKLGAPNKVIWGDSHADHFFPGLLRVDKKSNWLLIGRSSCPPLIGIKAFFKGEDEEICARLNQKILKTIIANHSIKTVVLASLGPFYISDKSYAADHLGQYEAFNFILKNNKGEINLKKPELFYQGLKETIVQLQAASLQVIVIKDNPEIPFKPSQCISRPLVPGKPCLIEMEAMRLRQKEYNEMFLRLKKDLPNTLIYNPIPTLCDKEECSLIKNNHLIYRDSHHLSLRGSVLVAKNFILWLQSQIA